MDRTRKKPTSVDCYFECMSEVEVRNYPTREPRRRAIVTCSTDDEQLMFFEVREIMIDKILEMNVEVDDAITVDFVFEGRESHGRGYNNLFINDINFSK